MTFEINEPKSENSFKVSLKIIQKCGTNEKEF